MSPFQKWISEYNFGKSPLESGYRLSLEPVSLAEKQAYVEWLVGATANYEPGVQSPEEQIARAMLPSGKVTEAQSPNSSLTVSADGIAFIKSWERGPGGGVALTQYPSVEGGSDTIGWGHKMLPGEDFSGGISELEAEELFASDLAIHEQIVRKNVEVPLSQTQFDALVALTYTSPKALKSSTLLDLLNTGDYNGAAQQILRWDKAGRPPVAQRGLTDRRQSEQNIFLNGVYNNH